jgi:hypothetical protein
MPDVITDGDSHRRRPARGNEHARVKDGKTLMSDHLSGPRALADPSCDICDLYAFPSPERTGHLVLVVNVFPFAGPTALFSDAVR